MATIREAVESDVESISNLFIQVYGLNYGYKGFYDSAWLKKNVFDENTIFLVGEHEGKIIATVSAVLDEGDENNLIAEIGRMIVKPVKVAMGISAVLVKKAFEMVNDRVHYIYSESRTVHLGAQKLSSALAVPVGFEPLKYSINKRRECISLFAYIHPIAKELRRGNPRVISEVSVLAQTVLNSVGLPVDVIVEDEIDGYPTDLEYSIRWMVPEEYPYLLRIQRGRVTGREVFSKVSIAQGFFRLSKCETHYLVAHKGTAILGAIGITYDAIDKKVRIIELISTDDAVKGFLLSNIENFIREKFDIEYEEVDVSAYSPKIQRTMIRLGFVPVAYCPSMVFYQTERFDIIRMAKVCIKYDIPNIKLLPEVQHLKEIVEFGLSNRFQSMEITAAIKNTILFKGIPDGDLYQITSVSHLRNFPKGTVLLKAGTISGRLYIIVKGAAEISLNGSILGITPAGRSLGDIGMVEKRPHTADVTLLEDSEVVEIELARLATVMEMNPKIGYYIMNNIAKDLSEKLRLASTEYM